LTLALANTAFQTIPGLSGITVNPVVAQTFMFWATVPAQITLNGPNDGSQLEIALRVDGVVIGSSLLSMSNSNNGRRNGSTVALLATASLTADSHTVEVVARSTGATGISGVGVWNSGAGVAGTTPPLRAYLGVQRYQ